MLVRVCAQSMFELVCSRYCIWCVSLHMHACRVNVIHALVVQLINGEGAHNLEK